MEKIIAKKSGRLDKILQENLNISRNQIENFIKKEGILVNEQLVKKCGFSLKGGEEIVLKFPTVQKDEKKPVDFDVDIIYEDEDILIVNKPPFLTIHPAPSVKEATLVDWLKYKGISLSTISGEERHGIVHRIDKETSGALVIAKNNDSHTALSKQLENKSMGRYYLAIIDLPLKENMIIEKPIGRNPSRRTKMAIIQNGRYAKSAFVKIEESLSKNYELISAKLFTGRTHQIRVHLESISRHILGDDIYGFKSKKDKISRVMLHAYIIYFTHPRTKKTICFKAPLFGDFETILEKNFNTENLHEKISSDYIISCFNNSF